jgi:hypothetical protein
MFHEAFDGDGRLQLQLTVAEAQVAEGTRICEAVAGELGGGGVESQLGLTRVVLVGSGMHQRPGVYARAFRALLAEEIEVFAISTSGISITLLVLSEREDDALRVLHGAFIEEEERRTREARCKVQSPECKVPRKTRCLLCTLTFELCTQHFEPDQA